MSQCFFCHKNSQIADSVGRQDRCPHCGRDLHICKNCEFYDPKEYNECREPQAERVIDKEASNFCDYFRMAPSRTHAGSSVLDTTSDARKKLEELFKKK